MALNRSTRMSGSSRRIPLSRNPDFGPRPGWGTVLGLTTLAISLVVWIQAQPIVFGLMNGGHVSEGAVTATLDSLRRSAAIGTGIGSILSARVAVAALQSLLASIRFATVPSVPHLRPETSRSLESRSHQRRSGRYASDPDPGGLYGTLSGIQYLLSEIPNQTAAGIANAAVFLWVSTGRSANFFGRGVIVTVAPFAAAYGQLAAGAVAAFHAATRMFVEMSSLGRHAALRGHGLLRRAIVAPLGRLGPGLLWLTWALALRPAAKLAGTLGMVVSLIGVLLIEAGLKGTGHLLQQAIRVASVAGELASIVVVRPVSRGLSGMRHAIYAGTTTAAAVIVEGRQLVTRFILMCLVRIRNGVGSLWNLGTAGIAIAALPFLYASRFLVSGLAATWVVAIEAARNLGLAARHVLAFTGTGTFALAQFAAGLMFSLALQGARITAGMVFFALVPVVAVGTVGWTVLRVVGARLGEAGDALGSGVEVAVGLISRWVGRSADATITMFEWSARSIRAAVKNVWLAIVTAAIVVVRPGAIILLAMARAATVLVHGIGLIAQDSVARLQRPVRVTWDRLNSVNAAIVDRLIRVGSVVRYVADAAGRFAGAFVQYSLLPVVVAGSAVVLAGATALRPIREVANAIRAGIKTGLAFVSIGTRRVLATTLSAITEAGRGAGTLLEAAWVGVSAVGSATWDVFSRGTAEVSAGLNAVARTFTALVRYLAELAHVAVIVPLASAGSGLRRRSLAVFRTLRGAALNGIGAISRMAAAIAGGVQKIAMVLEQAVANTFSAVSDAIAHLASSVIDLVKVIAEPATGAATVTRNGAVDLAMSLRFVWLGADTAWRLIVLLVATLGRIALLPLNLAAFTGSTLVTGARSGPDIGRLGVALARNGGRNVSMSEFNMSRDRVLSFVALIWVIGIGGLFVAFMFPDPEETIVVPHWTTGHLTRDGLLFDMQEEFNRARHRTEDGTLIEVKVINIPSELIGKDLTARIKYGAPLDLHRLTNGYVAKDVAAPVVVTPSSAHWLVSTNHEVEYSVVDFESAESIVRPVIGIVTYEELARCLGWPEQEIGFQDIIDLRANFEEGEGGWASLGCDPTKWGNKPLLAFTDPTTSSTGRSLHLALYSIFANKAPQNLTIEDVNDPAVVAKIREFQGLIDHYQIGTTVLNTKIVEGPRYGHFFVMPEDNLIHLIEGTEKAVINGFEERIEPFTREKLVMIYPKEGSMPRNNCACIVTADWVSEEQKEAAHQWIDFIREDEQQRKFMAAGFRPGTDLSLDDPASKITAAYGLDPLGPTRDGKSVLNPSYTPPGVAAEIDSTWQLVKRPGIVEFVVDTSGSMLAEDKLEHAKAGVEKAITAMALNNQVGLRTFSDEVEVQSPLAKKSAMVGEETHGSEIAARVKQLHAGGETALFDAIRDAVIAVDQAEGDESAIRAIVVLTDGQANRGSVDLDDLVKLESTLEVEVGQYPGWKDTVPLDVNGAPMDPVTIFSTGLRIPTKHDVQIFFIAVGQDADLNVGRILAQSTNAHLRGVKDEDLADLADVLEEFSHYF